MPPEGGFRVLSRRPVPPSATGPVSSVEVAAGPQARGGGGKCAGGQRRADRFRNHDQPLRITKRLYRSIVGRLLDTFNNDERGVSVLQHFRKLASPAFSGNYGMFERIIGTCGDRKTGFDAAVGANRV
jgi:hypothetical protein